MSASELRREWENRNIIPLLYSNPERLISLNCQSASISMILVGAYPSMDGDERPIITIDSNQTCNVSTEPVIRGINVYECVLESPVAVDGNISLTISQRDAINRIGFLHDGQIDTSLISVNSSKCVLTAAVL